MKKFYLKKVILMILILKAAEFVSFAQCPAGYTTATANWDNLDYLTRSGTYASFVSNAMIQNQSFTIGPNRFSINIPVATISSVGENTSNTAEAGSFGAGADVEYKGNGTITITFDNVVQNLKFSLYDIDSSQIVNIKASDDLSIPLNITMAEVTPGVITVTGNNTISATGTASAVAVANTDTKGSLNVSIGGNSPLGTTGVKTITITISGTGGVYYLSELSACVAGSFPLNYYAAQQPFVNQPAYYLVTPDNNSVYLFNPLTGKSDWLFSEPSSPWVNSMAYDHVNRILYYVMDHSSPVSTNRSLKKYDFNTETISTVIADITTLGIPLYEIVVESAGAAFYNGSLFLGVEGTNTAKNSGRESIIWRIDFDALLKPVKIAQVFAFPADNGAGLLTHDWGDFTIKDGLLYDFNTGNSGSTSAFIHYNMQTGMSTTFNTNGNPAPIQAGQTWNGRLYWTGGQSPEAGRVALYNENGTIGAKIPTTVTACSPPWVGRAGDASDPFRPKSDFGDAPDSYDPNPVDKATHEFDCNLRLGATFDREWDKTSSANASADGTDEDGIATVSSLRRGTNFNFVQDIQVYNNTGSNATLAGWLDYNGNGIFEATEGVTIVVPTSAAIQTMTLAWNGITCTLPLSTTTFMRIRLTSSANNMTVNNPTRWLPNGEVEDYPVFVNVLLPVELISFNATPYNNTRVLIDWKTGKELNFKGFDIERSRDGLNWSPLTYVAGNYNIESGNDYLYYDEDPIPGKSYYRLKLISSDGNYRYSEIRSVVINDIHSGLSILPNPVRTNATIRFAYGTNDMADIYVFDTGGKKVFSKTVSVTAGNNEVRLDNLQFARGIYVVQVVTGMKTMNTKMIVQ
ncbi:MAG TPA: T9SS type A sorting domain-containing protein [Flavitalea sp.]|nr:T9SS type A sorting domain-containing protein [Flavitalea sp.]